MSDVTATVCPAGRPRSPEAEAALAELATAAARALAGAPPPKETALRHPEYSDKDALLERKFALVDGLQIVRSHLTAAEKHIDEAMDGWPRFEPPTSEDMRLASARLARAADELRLVATEAHGTLGEGPTA